MIDFLKSVACFAGCALFIVGAGAWWGASVQHKIKKKGQG